LTTDLNAFGPAGHDLRGLLSPQQLVNFPLTLLLGRLPLALDALRR